MNGRKNNLIEKAFKEINRSNFILPQYWDSAGLDVPLPIGFGQTISQPTTVKFMLEWLEAELGDKVLDVGSGSGWTAALLSNIIGDASVVYAVERVAKLMKFGEENCQRAGIKNAKFFLAKKDVLGLPRFAPYNRILVSASAGELPPELIKQLKINGKLVIPVGSSILEITKKSKNDIEINEHFGFTFVPLIK